MDFSLIGLLRCSLHKNQFKQVHARIITKYPNLTSILVKRLIDSSIIGYARRIVDRITQPDEALYASLITAYTKLSLNKEAVSVFAMMHNGGARISNYAILPAIKSCSSLLAADGGKQVHGLVINYGLDSDVFVQTALMDLYSKIGDLGSTRKIFYGISVRDPACYNCLISGYSKAGDVMAARCLFDEMTERTVVSWNSMISCYSSNGFYPEALGIFERMRTEHFHPNEITLVTLLSISAKLGDLEQGLKVKKLVDDNHIRMNMIVSTAVVEMLVKCGAVDEARQEFDRMSRRDIVAWSTMIAGYAQNGRATEALELFECMKRKRIRPNEVTLVGVLSACTQMGCSGEVGECIGSYVESQGMASSIYVSSALLDMYCKFGAIGKARQVFDRMPHKDIVTWNSMIVGLAVNGFAEDAIVLYDKMKEAKVKPNDITFVGLLTACCCTGLVELGLELFASMKLHHEIVPKVEHYACIVDLFCKSGRLQEAYEFVCRMEIEPNVVIWGTLLSASRTHFNVELAEYSVQKLLELEPENSGNYVLLSNIYASVGRWQEAFKVRNIMKDNRVQKIAAYSWIEVDNIVHIFLVGDTSHPRYDDVDNTVDRLARHSIWVCYDVESNVEPQ